MLEAVIFLLLILAAITASAQPVGDGVPLLRQVAEAARSAKGWRAEGMIGESPLSISTRGPREMRFVDGRYPGDTFDLTVCDGSELWNAWDSGISASGGRAATATTMDCNPVALQWDSLLDSLRSAFLAGKDSALGCTQVWADYATPNGPATAGYIPGYRLRPVARELCADEASKAVLWERLYMGTYVVSLTKIEREPVFGPDEFKAPPFAIPAKIQDLYLLDALPVHSCSGTAPSLGCGKNPLAIGDRK